MSPNILKLVPFKMKEENISKTGEIKSNRQYQKGLVFFSNTYSMELTWPTFFIKPKRIRVTPYFFLLVFGFYKLLVFKGYHGGFFTISHSIKATLLSKALFVLTPKI